MNCKVCHFFARTLDPMEITKIQGGCHRFPPSGFPVPAPQGIAVINIIPTVQGGDWCGEFVAAKEKNNIIKV